MIHEVSTDFEMVSSFVVRSVKGGESSMTDRGSTDRKEMGLGNTQIKWAFHCAKCTVSQRGL